jgi:pSer/pThr/pTyr-binding forkhead associated (FHA) protein
MPRLVINRGDGGISPQEIAGSIETIGREPDNTIVLEEASVSRHHAEMIVEGGRTLIRDLQSTTGTFVNGVPITEIELTDGDVIQFGPVECRFEDSLKEETLVESNPEPSGEEPAHNTSFGSQMAALGKAAFGEAKRNSQMAGVKARIEKLKLIDLNKVHYALGRKCFELGLHQDRFPAQYAAIIELEKRIKAKRDHVSPANEETTGAKIRRIAGEAKQAAEAEGLALKEKQLLTEFGNEIAGLDDPSLDLKEETEAVAAVNVHIRMEEENFTSLTADSTDRTQFSLLSRSLANTTTSQATRWGMRMSSFARNNPRLAAVVLMCIAALVVYLPIGLWRKHYSVGDIVSFNDAAMRNAHLPPIQKAVIDHLASEQYRGELLYDAEVFARTNGPHLTRKEIQEIVDTVISETKKDFWKHANQ